MKRLSLVFVIATVVLSVAYVTAASFAWAVGMRDGKLVVVVDTTASPANMVVDTASFNATFFDAQRQRLGQTNVGLPVREIRPGQRKMWSFDPRSLNARFAGAVEVSTDRLFTAYHAGGLKNDGEEVAATESINPARLGGGVVIPPPASLGDRCAVYGRRAVEQYQRNQTLSCGYAGNRWSSDASHHSTWCNGASASEADQETIARDALLRQCVRKKIVSTVIKQ